MLLHTPAYLFFLLIVVLLFWLLPSVTWRKVFLLVSSAVFYALFDVRFLILLVLLIVVGYWLGRAIPENPYARRYAWLSVVVNLGVLAVFKYTNFFLDSLSVLLHPLGISILPTGLTLLLPIGISFYTFQGISYTTEIYRGKLKPVGNFLDYALYIVFFPKLIAGPLARPAQFLNQLQKPVERLTGKAAMGAAELLLLGLIKKIVIADSIAGLADVAFRAAAVSPQAGSFAAPLYIQGFYLYAIQIYADFSGYTDIARASAMFLGFALPENFQQPYLAPTVTVFWNRWHMSLTQWFREYLFFPLSRMLLSASQRKYARLIQVVVSLATMALIGFWHGASWTFIAWGVWQGIWLSVESLVNFKPTGRWQIFLSRLVTFHLVAVGWVMFRSESFQVAGRFLKGLVSFEQIYWLPGYLPSILVAVGVTLAIDLFASNGQATTSGWWRRLKPILIMAALLVLVILAALDFARGTYARPFIYGQF